MKYIAIILSIMLLSACQTTHTVTVVLPEIDPLLLEPCESLKTIEHGSLKSEVLKSVTENYTRSNKCSVKASAWIEWYKKNSANIPLEIAK